MGHRDRIYGVDLAFAEWHRHYFKEHYHRRRHCMSMADRDWTEFCYYCGEPLAILEEKLDFGRRNLLDKDYRTTIRLAELSRLRSFMIAPKIERPQEVQDEIDELQARVIKLQTQHPIPYFSVMELWPRRDNQLRTLSEEDFALFIASLHRHHHDQCEAAARMTDPVDLVQLNRIRQRLGLPVTGIQENLFDERR